MEVNQKTVALITGANGGLGQALIQALLTKSVSKIYATARNPSTLLSITEAYGERIIPLKLDVTKQADIDSVVASTKDVNLLINNAGIFSMGDVFTVSSDVIRQDMEVNYFGLLNIVRAWIPVLEQKPKTAIANILSISSLASVPSIASYSASKSAAHSLTQSMRALLKHKHITIHGVYPGPIDTSMTEKMNILKANPLEVAIAIVEGIVAGNEEIFPDNMSRQGGTAWMRNPKLLEQLLAST